MSDTEIKEKQLDTLAKYGTHTITVSEIYTGNIKSNNVQTMISFSIKVLNNGRDKGTFDFTCADGTTWYQWAESSSEPFYTDATNRTCLEYNGSLQELILSDSNQNKIIDYAGGYQDLTYSHNDSWVWVKRGDEIVEDITYILEYYED